MRGRDEQRLEGSVAKQLIVCAVGLTKSNDFGSRYVRRKSLNYIIIYNLVGTGVLDGPKI